MKKWQWLLICILCFGIGGVIGHVATGPTMVPSIIQPASATANQPVIFVPGSNGTVEGFNGTFAKLNRQATRHVLKVTVLKNGHLKTSGRFDQKTQHPVIVVAFENNTDGDENVFKQSEWFKLAAGKLAKQYHFTHFGGVGYSNGGLVLTRYAERSGSGPKITRLLTLGTPYNGMSEHITQETRMLADLKSRRQHLSKDLVVYSVGGTINDKNDGIVPAASVAAGRLIFQKQVADYMTISVSQHHAAHTELPDNPTVISLIQQLMFK